MKNRNDSCLKEAESTQGFSLLELVLVLAIIAVLAAFLLPKGFDALRNSRVAQVQKTCETLKTAITDYIAMPGGSGSIPRTEGPGVPATGAALSAASDTAKGNAARLDTVLLASGKLERPISLRMGTQVYTSAGTGNEITWDQPTQAFAMTPDAAPQRDWSLITRVEARSSNPLLSPSAALGANFRLDGINNRASNLIVAYLVIPACPAKDAYQLALAMNAPQLAPVENAACDIGLVAYAAPVNGTTDVYVYLGDI